jgi:phenylpropionate dioxygenase-like ring-hydroxylating dioxygenase large terminal subunit
MLSREENELLTRTSSGTRMGELIRRYWIPALLSEEIPGPDCPPVRVRLLGEDLVAFRDSQGRVGLLDEFCSHKRASLFYGRNEECGLRCIYHGWKYDVEGNVVETPAEPADSQLRYKVRHKTYPCHEAAGVVFAYMGPKNKVPLFPNYPWLIVPPNHVIVTKFFLECNYLQALEGDCDTSHTAYLHRGNRGGGVLAPREDPAPTFEVEHTWCGIRAAAIRRIGPDKKNVRVSTFAMPAIGSVPIGKTINGKLDGFLVVYQIPSDDHTTWRYNFRFKRHEPMTAEEHYFDKIQVGLDYRLIANRGNGYLLDREKQRTTNYTGIEGFATQDACVTESMGSICDRTREHLGASDSYVIALRRFLLKAVRDFQQGIEPPGLVFDPSMNDFSAANCTSVTVAREASWKETEERMYGS